MRSFARQLVARIALLALSGALLSALPGTAVAGWTKPSGLRVQRLEATAVTMQWTAVAGAPGYQVSYFASTETTAVKQARSTGAQVRLTGLKPATTYLVTVRVVDSTGRSLSAASSPVTVTVAGAGAAERPARSGIAAAKTTASAAATSFKPPTALKVTSRSRSALAVSWTSSGAAAYRVKYATAKSWKGAKYKVVKGTSVELTGLAAGRTYYVKARSVTAADEARSGYSSTVRSSTRSAGSYPYLRPSSTTVSAVTGTTAKVAWPSRGAGLTYRVRYDTDAGFGSPAYQVVKAAKLSLTKLLPNTLYSVSVRVVDATNTRALSEYAATVTVKTPTTLAPLRVASYNVKAHNSFHDRPNELPWLQRRTAVAALIKGQAPDVIALQEAQQSRIRNADGKLSKLAQMEDLANRLGPPYKLVNKYRYDCVKSTTLTRCVKKDRQASRGIRIVYNSAELTVKSYGAKRLPYVSVTDMERYVSWAIFHQRDSGKDFMFVDVHFENIDDMVAGSTQYYENRKKQTRESLAEVKAHNPKGLPVIFAGDLNSTKSSVPDNAPYDIMRAAGYTDPLGNTYKSTKIAPWATAEKRINAEYNSYNRWLLSPPKSSHPNGSYFDYILTSSPMRVSEWETAMSLNPDGTYKGVIPSDHHLIRATVWLP